MFNSGYVAIVGLPNVGKSTLLNQILGEKIAIVTEKPQTTRHRILGILHRPQAQILFLDTPGIHKSTKLLNAQMIRAAWGATKEADLFLHLVFPNKKLSEADFQIASRCRKFQKPYLVAINQIDRVDKQSLLPQMKEIADELKPDLIIPISGLKQDGLEILISEIEKRLPEGPAYYSEDFYTDRETQFLIAEIIREKATVNLHQELPYSLATQVESIEKQKNITEIHALIVVEKDSQKAMIIGKHGKMLQRIGSDARKEIEKLVKQKVLLKIFVKVISGWTKSENKLQELGLNSN